MQIYKPVVITSLTGFDIAFTNVDDTLNQRRDKVVSAFFQRCFNVVSTLFQRRTPTLYQRYATLKI